MPRSTRLIPPSPSTVVTQLYPGLKHPELWENCVLALCPSLGPTGLRLYDLSGRQSHGTLTNMDVGSDWVVSDGRYAIAIGSAVYERVAVSMPGTYSTVTISAWCYPIGANTNDCLVTCGAATFQRGASSPEMRWWTGTTAFNASAVVPDVWQHWAVVKDGTRVRLYHNGRQVLDAADTSTVVGVSEIGGYGGSLGNNWNGLFDDVRYYGRALPADQVRALASRPGIAYELESWPISIYASGGVSLTAGVGAATGTGHAPSVMVGAEVAAGAGAGSGSGYAPDVSHGHALSAGAGAGTGTGHAPSLSIGGAVSLTAGAGAGSGAGHAPSVVNGHALTAGVGSGTGVGYSTAPEIGAFISIGSGTGTGAGYAPTVTAGGAALTVSRRKLFLSGGLFV